MCLSANRQIPLLGDSNSLFLMSGIHRNASQLNSLRAGFSTRRSVFPCIFPSSREKFPAAGCWSGPLRAPRVGRLVARHVSGWSRAQLAAGHRLKDFGGDREALLSPALCLAAVQDVVREEPQLRGGGDLARKIAGER